jgi:hypothetical protein
MDEELSACDSVNKMDIESCSTSDAQKYRDYLQIFDSLLKQVTCALEQAPQTSNPRDSWFFRLYFTEMDDILDENRQNDVDTKMVHMADFLHLVDWENFTKSKLKAVFDHIIFLGSSEEKVIYVRFMLKSLQYLAFKKSWIMDGSDSTNQIDDNENVAQMKRAFFEYVSYIIDT